MKLKVGDKAPDFILKSTSGKDFTLSKNKDKYIILYFYPKDFTPVCTLQACAFKDTFDFFKDLDIPVYGISSDTIETHRQFKAAHNLPFDLLADIDSAVSTKYGAVVPLIKFTRRITFLLDSEMTVLAIYENFLGSKSHVNAMIDQLKK